MKNYIYIKLHIYTNKEKTNKYINKLLVIGFFKKWFKFKYFFYFNFK